MVKEVKGNDLWVCKICGLERSIACHHWSFPRKHHLSTALDCDYKAHSILAQEHFEREFFSYLFKIFKNRSVCLNAYMQDLLGRPNNSLDAPQSTEIVYLQKVTRPVQIVWDIESPAHKVGFSFSTQTQGPSISSKDSLRWNATADGFNLEFINPYRFWE